MTFHSSRTSPRRIATLALAAGMLLATAACSSSSSGKGSGGGAGGVADGSPLDPQTAVTISIDCAPGADQAAGKADYADDLAVFKVKYPNVTIDAKPYVGQCEVPAQQTAEYKAHDETGAFHAYFTDQDQTLNSGDAADISAYVNDRTVPGYSGMLASVKQNLGADGKVYALPINYYSTGLVYNRDLFKQAGLDPDKPPVTWDQVQADAKKIAALGGGVTGYEDYSGGNNGGWHFTSELYSLGGKMVSADGTKAAFDSPQGKQVLQRLHDMRFTDQSIGATPLTQWADAFPPLATGKVGMFIGAPDVVKHLIEVLGADKNAFGLGPMPGATGPAASLGGGDLYYLKKGQTPNQIKAEIAWIDFEYLTPDAGQFNFARSATLAAGSKDPVAISVPQPYFWSAGSPQLTAITDSLKTNGNLPLSDYDPYVNSPTSSVNEPPAAQQLYKVLDTAMSAVLTDPKADVDSLLATAESQANQILANQ
ncbi:extracellular solute-binding protein [Kitasatospora viridis]|uniref:Carbohydrate ABC transporter substrate-binding protein (CUT1 family) n=1 Tax=Kitasatospora viridis TaxID=281105 RepID=A0A561SEI5_9ACTN|nr:extracellular solute-binding protein [Kitasatospora viridis]TWF73258.1 carbohydrate ABC transporter substrate-binding protein (CUT1 family) [Kitasatospora viridis]